MKTSNAVGFIPYEIGDEVKIKESNIIWIITEISMTQYVAAKNVVFRVQLKSKINKATVIWRMAHKIESRVIIKTT